MTPSKTSTHLLPLVVIAAAVRGIVVATGLLAISFIVFAAATHQGVGDLYTSYFPRFRGSAEPVTIPRGAYLVFVAYVIAAAELAIWRVRQYRKAREL